MFKVVILGNVIVVIECLCSWMSWVLLQPPQDAEKILTLDCVMDEQTKTFYYYYHVSIFCFTSFNTFWKYLWLGKLDKISLGIKFCSRDFFFGFCLKHWGYFWFWFCSFQRLKNRAWVLGQKFDLQLQRTLGIYLPSRN